MYRGTTLTTGLDASPTQVLSYEQWLPDHLGHHAEGSTPEPAKAEAAKLLGEVRADAGMLTSCSVAEISVTR